MSCGVVTLHSPDLILKLAISRSLLYLYRFASQSHPHAIARCHAEAGPDRFLLLFFSYFVVDCKQFRDKSIHEIILGFYTSGKAPGSSQSAGAGEFSLNIGQIQVS